MSNPRYSYMKPTKKEEKRPTENKKKVNIGAILVTIMAVVNLVVLILTIIVRESGNKILFWSITTAILTGVAVVLFVCADD